MKGGCAVVLGSPKASIIMWRTGEREGIVACHESALPTGLFYQDGVEDQQGTLPDVGRGVVLGGDMGCEGMDVYLGGKGDDGGAGYDAEDGERWKLAAMRYHRSMIREGHDLGGASLLYPIHPPYSPPFAGLRCTHQHSLAS